VGVIMITAARELDPSRLALDVGAARLLISPFEFPAIKGEIGVVRRPRRRTGAAVRVDRLDRHRCSAGPPPRPARVLPKGCGETGRWFGTRFGTRRGVGGPAKNMSLTWWSFAGHHVTSRYLGTYLRGTGALELRLASTASPAGGRYRLGPAVGRPVQWADSDFDVADSRPRVSLLACGCRRDTFTGA